MSFGEVSGSTISGQAIHFTAQPTIHDHPLLRHNGQDYNSDVDDIDIDNDHDHDGDANLECQPWIWLHGWYQDTQHGVGRQKSGQLAETPFAIAAFSSIFGTFMLVRAIAVKGWLVDHTHWDGTGHAYDNDPILVISTVETVLLALAMVCGLLCSLQLIARTRFRFYVASCSCKYLSGLQAMLCLSAQYLFYQRAVPDTKFAHVWSRGFWSCTVTSVLLSVASFGFTVDWLLGYPYSDLSPILKGMVLPSLMACITIAIGALSFMRIEAWAYSEALMFCLTALTTIGYGDVAPTTNLGRIVFLFYAGVGISVMGYFFLSIRAVITGSTSDIIKVNLVRADSLRDYSRKQRQKWLNIQRQDGPLVTKYPPEREETSRPLRGRTYSNASNMSSYTIVNMLHEKDRQILVQIITRSGVVRMSLLLLISWLGSAAVFYWLEENWSYLDALYFSFATLLTIGFGDLVPQNALAQEFWFFYVILSITVAAYFISLFGDVLIEKLQIYNDNDEEDTESDNFEQESRAGLNISTALRPALVSENETVVHPMSPESAPGPESIHGSNKRFSQRQSTSLVHRGAAAKYGSTSESSSLTNEAVTTEFPKAGISGKRISPVPHLQRNATSSSQTFRQVPFAVTDYPGPISRQH